MVQLISSPSIVPTISGDVDYDENPTVLFKFIEAKDWDSVKTRVEENAEEAASWVTRRGKDGKIRWKVLPLHAILVMKAPTDVVIPIINAYPEACSLADDEGKLPLHLAMKYEDIDEEVLKLLLKINPSGVNTKDKEGKLPLGRPVLMALTMLQDMEREKIRSEERSQLETKLNKERESKSNEIKKLQEEICQLRDESNHGHEELEVRLTIDSEIPEDKLVTFKEMEEEHVKQQEKIELQSNELALKEKQLQSALSKLASQEEYIMKYRKMNKEDVCELGTALSNINDLNTKIFLLQSQVDTQAGELKRKKEEYETNQEKEQVLLDEIEKIKEKSSMKNKINEISSNVHESYQASITKLTSLLNEIIVAFKDQIDKIKSIKSSDGQESTQEEKDEELSAVKSRYSAFLEKITKLLNDIIAKFNDQIKNIKDKSNQVGASLVEKKDAVNNKFRELFEKMINGTVDHFKHICKDRGEKEHALLTSEAEECEESNKSVEEGVSEEASKCADEATTEEDNKIVDEVVKETSKRIDEDVVADNKCSEEEDVGKDNKCVDAVECEENKDSVTKDKCDEENTSEENKDSETKDKCDEENTSEENH